jgi:hypothetical protein
MERPVAVGTRWRNHQHRLDVVIVEAKPAVVKIKPINKRGFPLRCYLIPMDDFLQYYHPKAA